MGHHSSRYTPQEADAVGGLSEAFEASVLPVALRLQNFQRYVRRQDIARFLAKFKIFELSMTATGSIVECGVFAGGGLLGWAHFSTILEPYNHTRRVIGFDTFMGFPELNEKDIQQGLSEHLHQGAFDTGSSVISEIQHLSALHDRNRPLGHIPKTELVAGDACETIPRYVEKNPQLLVSLLYLDFDLYEPTKAALQHLYPRVVKGGVVAFDELNCPEFPGETLAFLECLDLAHVKLCRFPFDPYISYFIKE
jgi:hypothetical protein